MNASQGGLFLNVNNAVPRAWANENELPSYAIIVLGLVEDMELKILVIKGIGENLLRFSLDVIYF